MRRGTRAEKRVASYLRKKGASVRISPGSKTSADIIAKWPSGRKWFVQVKSSSKGLPSSLSSKERKNLIERAKRNGGTPVIAQVIRGRTIYKSARTEQRLVP